VHTKPEDREPPKKRGRPPKSSYTNSETTQSRPELPVTSPRNGQESSTHQPRWGNQSTATSTLDFPKLDGERQNGSFLTNPFNDNFGFGPLDTLSEFNFAEQDILSFLNPSQSRNIRDPAPFNGAPVGNAPKAVVLQPDFVDWLQMNRDDYSFSLQHSSPHGLERASAQPAPNLIEPNDAKEVLVNPADPNTRVGIDEQTYADIIESLQTKYKVCQNLHR
jgi:hypothetical protein